LWYFSLTKYIIWSTNFFLPQSQKENISVKTKHTEVLQRKTWTSVTPKTTLHTICELELRFQNHFTLQSSLFNVCISLPLWQLRQLPVTKYH